MNITRLTPEEESKISKVVHEQYKEISDLKSQIKELIESGKGRITMGQTLKYEVQSSWWAGLISWPWLQQIASKYFAWKVRKKYKIYTLNLINKQLISKS